MLRQRELEEQMRRQREEQYRERMGNFMDVSGRATFLQAIKFERKGSFASFTTVSGLCHEAKPNDGKP